MELNDTLAFADTFLPMSPHNASQHLGTLFRHRIWPCPRHDQHTPALHQRYNIPQLKSRLTLPSKFTGICGLRTHTRQKRVLDGTILTTSSPWHVFIGYTGWDPKDKFCNRVVISHRHILMTLHCMSRTRSTVPLDLLDTDELIVKMNISNATGHYDTPVKSIIVHPLYNKSTSTWDSHPRVQWHLHVQLQTPLCPYAFPWRFPMPHHIVTLQDTATPQTSSTHTCTTPTSQHFLTAPCTYPYQSKPYAPIPSPATATVEGLWPATMATINTSLSV